MGWASYFENIQQRHAETTAGAAVIQGPAGAPPPEFPAALAAAYSRLRTRYNHIGHDAIQEYERNHWHLLSAEMDRLEGDVTRFDFTTVLASRDRLIAEAEDLSEKLGAVLDRAKLIVRYLDSLVFPILQELSNIHVLKKRNAHRIHKIIVPEQDADLEQNAIWLLHGWKALKEQSEALEIRYQELAIALAGNLQQRLMTKASTEIPDKDANSDK